MVFPNQIIKSKGSTPKSGSTQSLNSSQNLTRNSIFDPLMYTSDQNLSKNSQLQSAAILSNDSLNQTPNALYSSYNIPPFSPIGSDRSFLLARESSTLSSDTYTSKFPVLGDQDTSVDFWAPTASYSKTVKTAPIGPITPQDRYIQQQAASVRKEKQSAKWLTTGASVESTYMAHRSDAIETALQRNRLCQQYIIYNSRATEAYLSGNKAAAKKLSLAAQELNTQLQSLHTTASNAIFKHRNNTEGVIDLHGLHPDECIAHVKIALHEYKSRGFSGKILVVVGTGHHSKRGGKIGGVVLEYLKGAGYRPKEATMGDGRGGMLSINI